MVIDPINLVLKVQPTVFNPNRITALHMEDRTGDEWHRKFPTSWKRLQDLLKRRVPESKWDTASKKWWALKKNSPPVREFLRSLRIQAKSREPTVKPTERKEKKRLPLKMPPREYEYIVRAPEQPEEPTKRRRVSVAPSRTKGKAANPDITVRDGRDAQTSDQWNAEGIQPVHVPPELTELLHTIRPEWFLERVTRVDYLPSQQFQGSTNIHHYVEYAVALATLAKQELKNRPVEDKTKRTKMWAIPGEQRGTWKLVEDLIRDNWRFFHTHYPRVIHPEDIMGRDTVHLGSETVQDENPWWNGREDESRVQSDAFYLYVTLTSPWDAQNIPHFAFLNREIRTEQMDVVPTHTPAQQWLGKMMTPLRESLLASVSGSDLVATPLAHWRKHGLWQSPYWLPPFPNVQHGDRFGTNPPTEVHLAETWHRLKYVLKIPENQIPTVFNDKYAGAVEILKNTKAPEDLTPEIWSRIGTALVDEMHIIGRMGYPVTGSEGRIRFDPIDTLLRVDGTERPRQPERPEPEDPRDAETEMSEVHPRDAETEMTSSVLHDADIPSGEPRSGFDVDGESLSDSEIAPDDVEILRSGRDITRRPEWEGTKVSAIRFNVRGSMEGNRHVPPTYNFCLLRALMVTVDYSQQLAHNIGVFNQARLQFWETAVELHRLYPTVFEHYGWNIREKRDDEEKNPDVLNAYNGFADEFHLFVASMMFKRRIFLMKSKTGQIIQKAVSPEVDAIIKTFPPSFLYHEEDDIGSGIHFDALIPNVRELPKLMEEMERQGKNFTRTKVGYITNYRNPIRVISTPGHPHGFDFVRNVEHPDLIDLRHQDLDYRPSEHLERWIRGAHPEEFLKLKRSNSLYWTDAFYEDMYLPPPPQFEEVETDETKGPIAHPMNLRKWTDVYGNDTRRKGQELTDDIKRQLDVKLSEYWDRFGNLKFLNVPQVGQPRQWTIRTEKNRLVTKRAIDWYREDFRVYIDTWIENRKSIKPTPKPSAPPAQPPQPPQPPTGPSDSPGGDTDEPKPPDDPRGGGGVAVSLPAVTAPSTTTDTITEEAEIERIEREYEAHKAANERRRERETAAQRVKTDLQGINDAQEHDRRLAAVYERRPLPTVEPEPESVPEPKSKPPSRITGPRPRQPRPPREPQPETETETEKEKEKTTRKRPLEEGQLFHPDDDFESFRIPNPKKPPHPTKWIPYPHTTTLKPQEPRMPTMEETVAHLVKELRLLIPPPLEVAPTPVLVEPLVEKPVVAVVEPVVEKPVVALPLPVPTPISAPVQTPEQANVNGIMTGALEDAMVRQMQMQQMEEARRIQEMYLQNQALLQQQQRMQYEMEQQRAARDHDLLAAFHRGADAVRTGGGAPPPPPPPGGGTGPGFVPFLKPEEMKVEPRDTFMGVSTGGSPGGPPGGGGDGPPDQPPDKEQEKEKGKGTGTGKNKPDLRDTSMGMATAVPGGEPPKPPPTNAPTTPQKPELAEHDLFNPRPLTATIFRAPIDDGDDDLLRPPAVGGFNPAGDVLHVPMMRRRIWTHLREAFSGHPRAANPHSFFAPEKHPYPVTAEYEEDEEEEEEEEEEPTKKQPPKKDT